MNYMLTAGREAIGLLWAGDAELWSIAWTSVRLAFWSTLIACLLAVPLGVLIGSREFGGRRLVLAILHSLLAMPTVVIGLLVYSFISRHGLLGHYGWLFTPIGVIIGQIFLAFPIICAMTVNAFAGLDPRARRTAVSLGATKSQELLVLAREQKAALLAAVLAGFSRVFGEIGVAMMLGGNIRGHTRTLTTAIALENSKGNFSMALALGLVLLTVALGVNVVGQTLNLKLKVLSSK